MNAVSILVVDDDPSIRGLLAEVLAEAGHQVMVAANGAEALALVEQFHPTVAFVDLQMPLVDGRAFVATLREHGIELPIIVISGDNDGGAWAAEIKSAGYTPKPFAIDDIVTELDRVTDLPAERDEHE
jgi:two-component system, OmpR family, response regulator